MTLVVLVPCRVHHRRERVTPDGPLVPAGAGGRDPAMAEAAAEAYDVVGCLAERPTGCTAMEVCPGAGSVENFTVLERGHLVPTAWKMLSGRQRGQVGPSKGREGGLSASIDLSIVWGSTPRRKYNLAKERASSWATKAPDWGCSVPSKPT